MNYHSDLDIIFLYEADGQTKAEGAAAAKHATTNQHFFSELAQRDRHGHQPPQRLWAALRIDARLRPTGHSGALATSFDEFARYFDSGTGQLWERMALCKARIVYGPPARGRGRAGCWPAPPSRAPGSRATPPRSGRCGSGSNSAAAAGDLKRGPGGIVDVEFLVEMLQLRHAAAHPPLQVSNTLAALAELRPGRTGFAGGPRPVWRRLPAAADDRIAAAADQRHRPRHTARATAWSSRNSPISRAMRACQPCYRTTKRPPSKSAAVSRSSSRSAARGLGSE